ncbi:traf-interacting protein [Lasius niger]|uniref:Traf-interacting protein n=1 Tax=Lasius niger TaxID=67767 RepID=A0A0J7L3M5_LASNI|nr:traf-interacting protein [Lasius niger]
MKESNIKRYTSKNVTLEKQNAGLRQEVRKVESEINQKNATIHILKEQITYFKEKYGKYKVLTQKLSQKEKELEQFQNMRNTFSNGSFEDIKRMIEKTKDNDTLVTCFSVMKKEFEEHLDFCKRENLALRHRVNELENHICEFDNQGNSNKNSSNIIQKVNVYSQTNTKRKIENQNTSLSPRIKTNVIKMNQEDLSTTHECPSPTIKRTIIKRTKLHGQSAGNVNQAPVQVNPQTDQSDYSAQWAKYYRSIGKHREADMIGMHRDISTPSNNRQLLKLEDLL